LKLSCSSRDTAAVFFVTLSSAGGTSCLRLLNGLEDNSWHEHIHDPALRFFFSLHAGKHSANYDWACDIIIRGSKGV